MNIIHCQEGFTYYHNNLQILSLFVPSWQQNIQFADQFLNFNIPQQKSNYFSISRQEVDSPSFSSRIESSIILQSAPKTTLVPANISKKAKKFVKKNSVQKHNRNVISNLLRILLRNIMQANYYDFLIEKIIAKYSFSCSSKDFYQWIQSFGINYRNYIRFTEVKRLFDQSQNKEMSRILRILVRQYCKDVGARHCLTSRRIERSSINMHLGGLRQLFRQINEK